MATTESSTTTISDATTTVSSSSADTANMIIVLNTAANTVLKQASFPDVDVEGLENINDHLTTAQSHATNWIDTYSSDVLATIQGVISFAETFTALYTPMYTSAQNMASETAFDDDEIANLIDAIQALQTQVTTEQGKVQTTYTTITDYKTNVLADYDNFQDDFNTANTTLGGDTGEISQLQDKIESERKAMTNDALMIVGGTVGTIAGIACVVAGALGEFETGGVSTGLIVGGVALISGGVAATTVGSVNYNKTLKDYKDDMTTLSNLQTELTNITALKGQFSTLTDQLETANTALQSLVTAWQQLNNSFSYIVSDLQNPEDYLETLQQSDSSATPKTVSMIVSAQLSTANEDWSSALDQAKTILSNLNGTVYLETDDLPTSDNIQAAYAAQAA
ncbi:MAG: HBL/NHE enterotoxin family protein [Bacteroidota bacterium]